jgi:hypothetical protein
LDLPFFSLAPLDDRRILEPVGIMTDFLAVSTNNDIDIIYVDIDNIPCFNIKNTGEETPRQ